RAGADGRGPTRDQLHAGVLEDRLVVARGEAGGVVDRVDGDGEALGGAGVVAVVGRAAAVLQLEGDGGVAVGILGQRVVQRTTGSDRWSGGEQGSVGVVGDLEPQGLPGPVGRAGADGGRPVRDRLGEGVLVDRLVAALGEAGGVVDGGDVDG